MKDLKEIIQEKLKVSSKTNISKYQYFPKDYKELEKIVYDLIKERGDEADLNDIDTSKITDMERLFDDSNFDGNISNWDVSNVKDMAGMFGRSEFNSDISNWDVSNVTGMDYMFTKTNFNQDISSWNINPNCNIDSIFKECRIQEEYKPDFSKINHISRLKYVRESVN